MADATFMDVMRTTGPDGKILATANVLNEENYALDDIVLLESNQETSHVDGIDTALGSPERTAFNEGKVPSRTATEQITEGQSHLTDWSRVDKRNADLNGNTAAFRAGEDRRLIEGMRQDQMQEMIYGNVDDDPKGFNGFATRLSTASDDTDEPGSNIVDGGGSGVDNTSVYIVGWGRNGVFAHYPKGKMGGLQVIDHGLMPVTDADGGYYTAYLREYAWDMGLFVKNWKYLGRLANIDVSDLKADATSGANLINSLINLEGRMPMSGGVNYAMYCNRTIFTFLRLQIVNKTNVNLSLETVAGKRVMVWGERIPIRRVDQITNTESAVTGSFAAA
ncbi:MAG: major capsid protein [Halothiobacillaceae bacterium]